MSSTALVLMVRRDEKNLGVCERQAVIDAFRGRQVIFQRTDTDSAKDHDHECQEFGAAAVILPPEPLPILAMQNGFPHVVYVDDKLKRLVGIVPQYEDFVPEANLHAEHAYEMSSFGL